ncbi:MAG: BREX-2 system adenine-specific DNA-methyltransferase PglX, partial [Planctomycetes bacterium]|nr:BREX-2 system adenine-specific DNA-methyltransferase PglX [Planctomycetota bacterium]
GFTGQITSNSFMKREFGKKLIEAFFPTVDLTHVIDTSGAYIPGHGTPTVILFGRHRVSVARTLRTVLGIRGEPTTPDDPSQGLVWSAIVAQMDQPGSKSEFVSAGDSPRELFERHPWSIGGGGASELKELLDDSVELKLDELADSIGFMGIISEDDAYLGPAKWALRSRLPAIPFATGDDVRHWDISCETVAVFPYTLPRLDVVQLANSSVLASHFWRFRTPLRNRLMFGKRPEDRSMAWYEYMHFGKDRFKSEHLLAFASVATHNQFSMRRDSVLTNRHAPVVRLSSLVGQQNHIGILGLLNSSAGCFWMKQIFHDKGSTVDAHGARQTTIAFENFREFTGTGLLKFPIPKALPTDRAFFLDARSQKLAANLTPKVLLSKGFLSRESIGLHRRPSEEYREQLIADQEELDWECYQSYGLLRENLTTQSPPPIQLGSRAFEIVLARKMAAGETQTTWFERHGSTPITELPSAWPDDYRHLVEHRIALIESDPNIRLIEQPEYKRRWNTEPWESQLERALREWLLNRLEGYFDFDGRMK